MAYLLFTKGSKQPDADKVLKKAMEYNPYIPLYLLGFIDMPDELPGYIGIGDENEAVAYVAEALELWANDEKALRWFINMYKEMEDKIDRLIEERERER